MKTKGLSRNRTRRNPLERAFAKAWDIEGPNVLPWLVYPHNMSPAKPTTRECEVAATLIQWLGSTVGQAFLYKTVSKIYDDILDEILAGRTRKDPDFFSRIDAAIGRKRSPAPAKKRVK